MEVCLSASLPLSLPCTHNRLKWWKYSNKWKSSHKRKSCKIDYKYQFVFCQEIILSLFSLEQSCCFSSSLDNKIESEMAYDTTATFYILACTDYVDFGKGQDRFGRISLSKNSFDYSDVKLKVFKIAENKEFRLTQNLTMG